MSVADIVAAIRPQLAELEQLLLWAYADGHTPEGRKTPRAPRVPELDEQPIDPDPDFVPGAKHDTGLGNYRRRQAYQSSMRHLGRAEVCIAACLVGERQPQLVKPDGGSTLVTIGLLMRSLGVRLDILTGPLAYHDSTSLRLSTIAQHEVSDALTELQVAFVEADEPERRALQLPCRICYKRDAVKKKGGRCSTCDNYRLRNHVERPTELDGDDGTDAQARRLARGDGWGDEGGSCTTPLRKPDTAEGRVKTIR